MTQIDHNIPRHYHQLTSEQRGQIEALHDLNWSNTAIGCKLIPETTFKRGYNE